MGHSWVYLGDAQLPAEAVDAWLARVVTPDEELAAFSPPLRADFGLSSHESFSVRDVIRELASEPGVIELGSVVRLRVLADKSGDAWLTWRAPLVASFAALARHGGRGTLVVVGAADGPDAGFRLDVGRDLVRLDAEDVLRIRSSAAYREHLDAADAFFAQVPAAAPPSAAPATNTYLDHAMRTIAERVFFDARDGLRRIERRVLCAMRPDEVLSADALIERVRAKHPDQKIDAQMLNAMVGRRTATLSLLDEVEGGYELSPLAAQSVCDTVHADALSLPVPWLLIAGGQAIGVGMECDVTPMPAATVLDATLARLAGQMPTASIGTATVLVDGAPKALELPALIDAFIAHRRESLARLGGDVDARLVTDLRHWLSR